MIISTVISAICFIAVVFEALVILNFRKSCENVVCKVTESTKEELRADGCIVSEHWNTKVEFEYKGSKKSAVVAASTYCPKGQILKCYYHAGENIIFRRKDFRKHLSSSTLIILSVGLLFIVLNLLFHAVNVGELILKNITVICGFIVAVLLTIIGISKIYYSGTAIKQTRKNRVEYVRATVSDIIRKTSRYNENSVYTYYPVYKYNFHNMEHEVISKIGRKTMPKIGSKVQIRVNTKKGGPVEYEDVGNSMVMGISLLIIAFMLIGIIIFM